MFMYIWHCACMYISIHMETARLTHCIKLLYLTIWEWKLETCRQLMSWLKNQAFWCTTRWTTSPTQNFKQFGRWCSHFMGWDMLHQEKHPVKEPGKRIQGSWSCATCFGELPDVLVLNHQHRRRALWPTWSYHATDTAPCNLACPCSIACFSPQDVVHSSISIYYIHIVYRLNIRHLSDVLRFFVVERHRHRGLENEACDWCSRFSWRSKPLFRRNIFQRKDLIPPLHVILIDESVRAHQIDVSRLTWGAKVQWEGLDK